MVRKIIIKVLVVYLIIIVRLNILRNCRLRWLLLRLRWRVRWGDRLLPLGSQSGRSRSLGLFLLLQRLLSRFTTRCKGIEHIYRNEADAAKKEKFFYF